MFELNGKKYKLKESESANPCEGCALIDTCDEMSLAYGKEMMLDLPLDEIFLLCENVEGAEEFFDPIIVEVDE